MPASMSPRPTTRIRPVQIEASWRKGLDPNVRKVSAFFPTLSHSAKTEESRAPPKR
jgi:hypothetical protein